MQTEKHRWGKRLFLAYGIWMLWLLFGQRIGYGYARSFGEYLEQSVNLKPLRTIGNYWYVVRRTSDRELIRHIVINLAGNVIMFVPLGYFLPLIWKKIQRMWIWLVTVGCIVVSIEMMQMVTRLGSLDVDDVILNLTGSALGYLIWKMIHRREK